MFKFQFKCLQKTFSEISNVLTFGEACESQEVSRWESSLSGEFVHRAIGKNFKIPNQSEHILIWKFEAKDKRYPHLQAHWS